MMTNFVVCAHPDDEVLGMGGTIARLAAAGQNVHVAYMTDGVSGREEQRAADETRAQRRAAAEQAGQRLGIISQWFGDYPDNQISDAYLLTMIKTIERLIEQCRPDTIYTHYVGDLNLDHRTVAAAVLTAARPLPGCPVRRIYSFEVPSSTEWNFEAPVFAPNVFRNIEETIEVKLVACDCYKQEMRAFPHPRSTEVIRALAMWRGAQSGHRLAEAFRLVRSVEE